ncbi:hypothetical protein [Asticcacaulis sp. YBE204]|uniref:hypothetical protein n=1 Tax=Asticcacaulis sp. YBE204 TaxID=1282363 RepID=UPI0004CEC180|nr:hypothetical protein [Asticcacaulis sp. YBE204]
MTKQHNTVWPWCILAFAIGVIATLVMAILSFNFYIGFNPYIIASIITASVAAITWAWRNRSALKPNLRTNLLTFGGQVICMVIAFDGTARGLMAIYPPNFN